MKGGKKMQYLIFLILGIISICISFASKNANNTQHSTIKATGIITRVIYSDTGNVRYYVDVPTEGDTLKGKTIYYKKTDRKYHEGDSVLLEYHYTKNNQIQAVVDDPDLIPCNSSFQPMSKIMLVVGVVFVILFAVFFIKSFI